MAEEKRREFTPMRGTFPDPKKIVCKDCVFRDHTVVELFGKKDACGITRANCEIYKYPANKPHSILFDGGPCQYYTKETKATG